MKLINTEFILLIISTLSILVLMYTIIKRKPLSQLQHAFAHCLSVQCTQKAEKARCPLRRDESYFTARTGSTQSRTEK